MVVQGSQQGHVAQIIDGKAVAKTIRAQLKVDIDALVGKGHRRPGLAVVLAGDDAASALYVKNKIKACKEVGIESFFHKFDADITLEQLTACVQALSQQADDVDGILVQLPLPGRLPAEGVLQALSPEKDVDGLTTISMGRLLEGKPGLRPCTPSGVIELLKQNKVEISGKRAVVVGRSNLVGKPAALLLMQHNATVTVCHSKSEQLDEICRSADILVVAAGRKQFVKGSWVKPGACVIDVGIHHDKNEQGQSEICGDVEFAEASRVAAWITPVPGGVGPMTIAMLLSNTLTAYKMRKGVK
ncbi:MAG TPA: bifunctional methylenetetrahydrofolate dehydrogenase/methenyltetrahydrofolate cyclohydrolase FolD [Planktothrix sp.]|jgi:methylenetetrahydrofolate dehydrogenase (NADP+)/methenyltetrahydrofolate cyclohydrolase